MRIVIKSSDGPNLWLPIPLGLFFNRCTISVAYRCLAARGIAISPEQITAFGKELKRCRRRYRGLVLVEVECQNGDYVQVRL